MSTASSQISQAQKNQRQSSGALSQSSGQEVEESSTSASAQAGLNLNVVGAVQSLFTKKENKDGSVEKTSEVDGQARGQMNAGASGRMDTMHRKHTGDQTEALASSEHQQNEQQSQSQSQPQE